MSHLQDLECFKRKVNFTVALPTLVHDSGLNFSITVSHSDGLTADWRVVVQGAKLRRVDRGDVLRIITMAASATR